MVAHRLSGPPHVVKDKSIYVTARARKCLKSNVHQRKEDRSKTGADFLVLVGYVTKVRNKGFNKIGDHSRKDEMGMSKLVNGRA